MRLVETEPGSTCDYASTRIDCMKISYRRRSCLIILIFEMCYSHSCCSSANELLEIQCNAGLVHFVQHQRFSNPADRLSFSIRRHFFAVGCESDAKLWIYCDENESVSIFLQAIEPIKIFMANSKSQDDIPRGNSATTQTPHITLIWILSSSLAQRKQFLQFSSGPKLCSHSIRRVNLFSAFIANACVFRMYFRLIKIFGMSWFEQWKQKTCP